MEKHDKGIVIENKLFYRIFNNLFTFGNKRFLDYLLQDVSFNQEDRILDVGCGDGSCLMYVRQKMKKGFYVGIDPSRKLIKEAKMKYQYPNIEFFVNWLEDIVPCFQDWVICTFTFHHLPLSLKKKGIEEIARVLKPGGSFLYADFGKPDTLYTKGIMTLFSKVFPFWYEHIPSQMNNEVISLMNAAGFVTKIVEKKTVLNGRVYCIIARKE